MLKKVTLASAWSMDEEGSTWKLGDHLEVSLDIQGILIQGDINKSHKNTVPDTKKCECLFSLTERNHRGTVEKVGT